MTEADERRLVVGSIRARQAACFLHARTFADELVETEADLVRREGRDYEPASVLLERIAARRAAANH